MRYTIRPARRLAGGDGFRAAIFENSSWTLLYGWAYGRTRGEANERAFAIVSALHAAAVTR